MKILFHFLQLKWNTQREQSFFENRMESIPLHPDLISYDLMKKIIISSFKSTGFCILFSFCFIASWSQQDTSSSEKEHSHVHPFFEIGFSSAAVRLIEEKEITVGFHTHILANISHHLPFSAGMGYEYILDEHPHHSIGVLIGWNPVHELFFSVSPGVTTNKGNFQFTTHLEVNYAFELGKIHLGPSVEYAYSKGDTHISIGIHFGIPVNKR